MRDVILVRQWLVAKKSFRQGIPSCEAEASRRSTALQPSLTINAIAYEKAMRGFRPRLYYMEQEPIDLYLFIWIFG
jgi:hypothetical protein